jgi:hypothetical protein
MPDTTLSQAIREAYASAPSDVVILHTLEIRHPDFIDDDGHSIAVRVVRDHRDLTARLEMSASLNAGEMVTFTAMGFDLDLPPVDTAPVPEIAITLDNVSRQIVKHLDAAVQSQEMITVTYRPYLSNDLSGPQMDPPLSLVLTEVNTNTMRVTGKARMLDVGNKAFPSLLYKASNYSGLTR